MKPTTIATLLAWLVLVLIGAPCSAQTPFNVIDADESEAIPLAERIAKVGESERDKAFGRALAYYSQSDWAGTRAVLDSVIHDASGRPIIDSLAALAEHTAGLTYFQVYDDQNALPHYRRAIAIRDAIHDGPHKDRAHTRYNLANSMHWLGRPDTAMVLLRDAVDIYDRLSPTDTTNWLRSLKLLGVIATENFDRELLRSATVAMARLSTDYHQILDIDAYQASFDAMKNFLELKDYERALEFSEPAQAAARRMENPSLLADAVHTTGNIYQELGQAERARSLYRESISILNAGDGDPTSINLAYIGLAVSYLKERKLDLALDNLNRADKYPDSEQFSLKKAELNVTRGEIYELREEYDQALAAYNAGLRKISREPNPSKREGAVYIARDSAYSYGMSSLLYLARARMFRAWGKPRLAAADLEEVFAYQDLNRAQLNNDGSRYALSAEGWQPFNLALQIATDLHAESGDEQHLWEALTLSERAKAYSQLAALQQSDRVADRREQDLRNELAVLKRQLVTRPELEERYAAQQLRLELHLQSQNKVQDTIQTAISQEEIAGYLKEQETDLIEYHVGEELSHGFYVDQGGNLTHWTFPGADSLQGLVEEFRQTLAASAYRSKSLRSASEQTQLDQEWLAVGLTLTRLLLPRVELTGERLLLVPDGPLHYLPFAALPQRPVETPIDYSQAFYLSNDFELSTAFSLRYLLELTDRQHANYDANLLAFAPTFGGSTELTQVAELRSAAMADRAVAVYTGLPGLAPLTHNREEVNKITREVPHSRAYVGSEATLSSFVDAMAGNRILHVASHGLVSPSEPELSFLAFTQKGKTLEEEQLLFFNDLAQLPVAAELVVLSACETSLGKIVPGESVMSIGNAFARAGARSTLTSLWKVDDQATQRLMVDFYKGLTEGRSRAAALHTAQNGLGADGEYAHPYYWAAFTLNGEAGPVALPGMDWTAWWLFGFYASVAALSFYLFFRLRKREAVVD